MARFEMGDEVKLKIGSYESLVTVVREVEDVGPGVFELLTKSGQIVSVHESTLRSKQKNIMVVYNDKAREISVRNLYEQITGYSGAPGTGPADLILKFLRGS
jgi:hypothetical protein